MKKKKIKNIVLGRVKKNIREIHPDNMEMLPMLPIKNYSVGIPCFFISYLLKKNQN